MEHQAEGFAAVTACRVCLVNRELHAVQHAFAEHMIGIVFNRTEKADANLGEVFQIRRFNCREPLRYKYSELRSSENKAR